MRLTPVLVAVLAGAAFSQTDSDVEKEAPEKKAPPIGWRVVKFTNPSKTGARTLNAVVHYPASDDTKRPRNARLPPGETRFPVIVFLHGFGATGGMMVSVGQHFAEAGYIVVLTNTTRSNRGKQAINAGAFFTALKQANAAQKSFFRGRLDMKRVGISGHSMGGGNTMRVLADKNPGYKCGFCFAPWTTRGAGEAEYVGRFAKKVAVPLAIVHGVRDKILPWKSNAVRLYEAVQKDKTFKGLWVLDKQATHVNVAVPSLLQRSADPTFQLCAGMATAFFDRFLRGQKKALDPYLDPKDKPKGVEEVRLNVTQQKPIR